MAISVNWVTGEITVPKADTTLVQASPEIRELDVDAFRLALRGLEASADGRPWPKTHTHAGEFTVGGFTFTRGVNVVSPYFVTFEDGAWAVILSNANNNILDVATVNQVSIRERNSGGLGNPRLVNSISTDINSVIDILMNNALIENNPAGQPVGTRDVTIYEDDGLTIKAKVRISADGLTRTRLI